MDIKKVVVAGGGVLGSQIAYQSAFCGFDVTVWLRSEGSIERAKPKFERLLNIYLNSLEAMKTDKSAYCRGFSKTPDLSDEEIDAALNSFLLIVEPYKVGRPMGCGEVSEKGCISRHSDNVAVSFKARHICRLSKRGFKSV